MKSPDKYTAELRGRLNTLKTRFSQVEIARRTGVPAPNVHRYLRAGRIPAEFCLALVEAFDLSPEWLLRGEGEPITSDVKPSTAAKAGELLDLVKAMNAVARMRLGAVVGDRDRKNLRDLAETLETFDRLRERMNEKSRPVITQLMDDMSEAMQAFDMPRARLLRETAVEMSRLCTDDAVLERLDLLQSNVEYLSGRLEQALQFDRRVLARRVRDGRLEGGGAAGHLHLVMTLRDTGRIAEARRVCGAILSLLGNDEAQFDQVLELRMFMGGLLIELGELDQAMPMMREAYPRIAPGRRIAATIMMLRGFLMTGIMGYHEANEFGLRSMGSSRLLVREACMREDADMLAHALQNLVGRGPNDIRPDEYDAIIAQQMAKALDGKGKLGQFDRAVAEHPPVAATDALRRAVIAVHRGQFARLAGNRKALSEQARETEAALKALPVDVLPKIEWRLIHLRNMAALGKSKPWHARAADLRAELQGWVENGYQGLLPLA